MADADLLLDRILANALGTGKKDDKKVKSETSIKTEAGSKVKSEVSIKSENLKSDATVKGEGLLKNENIKGEGVKSEGVKNEQMKREGVKGEIKGEIKGEGGVKREIGDENKYALKVIDKKEKKKDKKKKRSRSRSRKRRRRSSSSESSRSKSPQGGGTHGMPQARVVAVRGHYAQYLSPAGETFYKNVLTNEVQWQKPSNFDVAPSRRAGEMTPGPGEAACYIFHMPTEWTESDLMQLFAPFGNVTTAHVQRDANGFSRSCGFVTYGETTSAVQASELMNGFGVDGKFLKVSLTQFQVGTDGQLTAPGGGKVP